MLTRSSAFPEMLTKCRLMKSIRLLPTLSGMFFLKRNCRHRIVCNNYVVFSTSGFKLKQQEISTSFWWLPFRRRYRSSFKLIRSTNRLPIHPSSTLRNVVEHTPGVTEGTHAPSIVAAALRLLPLCFRRPHLCRNSRHWRAAEVRLRLIRTASGRFGSPGQPDRLLI